MFEARILGIRLDARERRLGARALDLELRHEHEGLVAVQLDVRDRSLVREEPEVGEVPNCVRREQHEAVGSVLAQPVAALRELALRYAPHYLVCGKPRSTFDVAGSGQREVTTLPRV